MVDRNGHAKNVLRVGYPYYWGSLVPPLQHTAYADNLIANQFEALVLAEGVSGVRPLLAKRWSFSDDLRVFRFEIDTGKRFSDGTPLRAQHFKDAWEAGLRMAPKAGNRSTLDVLYKLEGFKDFETTGKLSGVVVSGDDGLELRFARPFRMAMQHLSASRYAVFIERNGKFLGTGPYILEEKTEHRVHAHRNPHSTNRLGFDEVEISLLENPAGDALKSGDVDVLVFAGGYPVANECEAGASNIACHQGMESAHLVVEVNGKKDEFFSDAGHRQAIQSLMMKGLADNGGLLKRLKPEFLRTLRVDPQTYLPMQPGRLAIEDADHLVAMGDGQLERLRSATKIKPLRYIFAKNATGRAIKEFLEESGITLDPSSGGCDFKDLLATMNKKHDADLVFDSLNVRQGDPDGIYHALGRTGAIASEMSLRPRVADMLEHGRELLDPAAIEKHYEGVSRAILEDVPYVHIGFLYDLTAYRSDRVAVLADDIRSRTREPLTLFNPK